MKTPRRVKKFYLTPINWLLLCIISIAGLVKFSGTPSLSPSRTRTPEFTNYRRLKAQTEKDHEDLKKITSGSSKQKELLFCGKERENHVPCFNATERLKSGEEHERHCEFSAGGNQCVVRTPKDYKIPLRWPAGRDVIWNNNVRITKDQFLSSGSMTKRLMLLEENQIAFQSEDGAIFDGVKDYSRQVAELIGLGSDTEFLQAGVRTVLDIGCGFGSFGAHLLSLKVMAVCVAAYEVSGSQVQLALERGLPAVIGSFVSRQLPYPSLSFDMVHCAQCGINWDKKEGKLLLEVDRLLKPGGYFVLTSPPPESPNQKKGKVPRRVRETDMICWSFLDRQDETSVWKKTADTGCYDSRSLPLDFSLSLSLSRTVSHRKKREVQVCENEHDDIQLYHQPLMNCISGTRSKRWVPVGSSTGSVSSSDGLEARGIDAGEFNEDREMWRLALGNYWSLLTPLIFSDHPKRPGDEDPLPPFNMIRNVMDMNARYAGLGFAFLEARKTVWVMNVVPTRLPNTLPLILDQSFTGVLHDWCEPFPTYPRTYDMIHAKGVLSLVAEDCSLVDLFLEMDRILRPEGWVIVSDEVGVVEEGRVLAGLVHWESRVVDSVNGGGDRRLLVCQKPFLKK